jgi:hypothetical protein
MEMYVQPITVYNIINERDIVNIYLEEFKMPNLTTIELNTLKAQELRTLAKEFQMVGARKSKKNEMIEFLEVKKSEQIEEARIAAEQASQTEEVQPETTSRKGRTRKNEVIKMEFLLTQ